MTKQLQDTVLRQPNSPGRSGSADATSMARQLDKALRILRMKQLIECTNLSRATLYVLMATDPTFPRKIKLTARSVGFLESEVDAWIVARALLRSAV
ncbi:AlpA family transcriptional regulator [Caballeronia sp. Lep1P3]|uniref:helix-turn-helix transcriptional regulator n=1 Tax=Caballeronia sp. Lep1P3 TaxID=2878150 RepID=UPI001FD0DB52|nr:AlpA family phage regulatory protein [Caballeronia sp. Lep1P3]